GATGSVRRTRAWPPRPHGTLSTPTARATRRYGALWRKDGKIGVFGPPPPCAPNRELARCGLFPGKSRGFWARPHVVARRGTAVSRSPDMLELTLDGGRDNDGVLGPLCL